MNNCVWVYGLSRAALGENIYFEKSELHGTVFILTPKSVKIIAYGDNSKIILKDKALRTFKPLILEVGGEYLGKVINPLNKVISTSKINFSLFSWNDLPIKVPNIRPVECKAPNIRARWPVCEPLLTGWAIIDAITPIGRGQRQLILGDRGVGKTQVALTTILNQRQSNNWCQLHAVYEIERLVCIYTAIGLRDTEVNKFEVELIQYDAMWYSIIVKTTSADSLGLQYLSALSSTAHGEFFRDNGMHALVVYDDLLSHAATYRTMSLVMGRSPGREAYPGDIFYLHSRLLERSAKLSKKNLFGSLSSLPIVETYNNDITSYVATNIISITDGQIYLDKKLFLKGIKPAVNLSLSISRVGSKAQPWLLIKATKSLDKLLRQYFMAHRLVGKLGWDLLLDEHKSQYQLGKVAMAVWLQPIKAPMRIEYMILHWLIVTEGLLVTLQSPQHCKALLESSLKLGHFQYIAWAVYYKKAKKDNNFYKFLTWWLREWLYFYNFNQLNSFWGLKLENPELHR